MRELYGTMIIALVILMILITGSIAIIEWRDVEDRKADLEQQRINLERNRLISEVCKNHGGIFEGNKIKCN